MGSFSEKLILMNFQRCLKLHFTFSGFIWFFFMHLPQFGLSQSYHQIGVRNGLQGVAERDLGYSQLKYTGIRSVISFGYDRQKSKRFESFSLNFANGSTNSRGGNSMDTWSLGLISNTLYHRKSASGKGVHFGWSLQSEINQRFHQSFSNFNNRMDYFTSVGPAIGFLFPILREDKKLHWKTTAHMQGLGFKFSSDYISSVPPVTEWSGNLGDGAWHAPNLFWIGRDWSMGCLSEIRYESSSGNSMAIQHQFDFQQLSVAQQVIRVRNSFLLNICVRL